MNTNFKINMCIFRDLSKKRTIHLNKFISTKKERKKRKEEDIF